MILAEPRHEPKVRQGVTTEIVGVDGLSYAPMPSPRDLDALIEMNAGLDGRPDGLAADWTLGRRIPRALDGHGRAQRRLDGRQQRAAHLAPGLGRRARRTRRRWPTCARVLANAMGDGALGVSSGLDYPPGAFATTDELAALTGEAARHGGFYHTHVRYALGDRYLDPFREAIEIGRRGGGPTSTSPTSITARRTRAAPSRCSRSSTTRAPKGWT